MNAHVKTNASDEGMAFGKVTVQALSLAQQQFQMRALKIVSIKSSISIIQSKSVERAIRPAIFNHVKAGALKHRKPLGTLDSIDVLNFILEPQLPSPLGIMEILFGRSRQVVMV